ncbi:restriction endonuclease subunit S [Pseudomonas stutzeri]|nr:restriction endonuclease subunit S [Stutzerimonas stutzeri]
MTALLTDNLPLLAGAPNGIKKLRELILELAVRGKLLPQDPSDEPASELLKRIADEKARLVAEGKIKKQKPLQEVDEEALPFELPAAWVWTRLGEITNFGTTTKKDEIPDDAWVLDLEDIEKDTSRLLQKARFKERNSLSDKNSFTKGDVLYGKLRPYLNKVLVAEEDGFCTTEILPFRCYGPFVAHYFMIALKSPYFLSYVNAKSYGMKMPRLGTEDGRQAYFPLPPLAEQHRIVAKVDELMALCDRLEAQQADADSAHTQLVQALLDSLTQAHDAEDFAQSWQRLAEHFHTLFTTESSIDALKQTLLQLAVMGKLVPQDPRDEPASELLKRIAEKKARLVAEGSIRKQKSLTEIADAEKPFQLPAGWEWVRLDSLLRKIGAGSTPLGGKQGYVSEGIKFLRSQNVWNEGLRLDDVALIPESTHQKMSGTHVAAGDLLFNITGASIGRCAIVPDDFDTGNVSQHVTIVRPVMGELRQFLHVILTSQLVQQTVMDVQVGVSREGLSIGKLSQFAIPCPPEAEQHRIVAKVDQLMALCDQLKARLNQARQVHEQLAGALVEQAVA